MLAADGTALSSPAVIAQSGSIALLTGTVVAATKAQAKALGAPYQAGDQVGQGGIEQAYQAQLAGKPSLTIRVEGPGSGWTPRPPASRPPGQAGPDQPRQQDQMAASAAVSAARTSKPVDLVAIQPSTGKVLAVVERRRVRPRPGRASSRPAPPSRWSPPRPWPRRRDAAASTVQCPAKVTIGGRTFHNDENEHLGTTSLQTAFAVSCNSTFAMLAYQRLGGSALASMAARFGFNAHRNLGIPATLGQVHHPAPAG